MASRATEKEILEEKRSKLMITVNKRAGFYRSNPQRFVKDYLNITLKLFQKILIYAMMYNNYFMYIAARGQGKTFLVALFCTIRCILYPGTKIVIASGTRSQANEVLLKIQDDFCKLHGWGSSNLSLEISSIAVTTNKGECYFKNGSYIKVVTAADTARCARANIIVIDEFRMVPLDVINTVLRRFLTAPRHPAYMDKPEYKHLIERNKEIYLSSAWYQSHWSFEKVKAYFVNMLDDKKKYFVCSLPYQISIMEGLLDRSQVEDEMSEADFDSLKFQIEMQALFYSDTEGSFFKYDDISKCRKLKQTFFSPEIYMNNKNLKVPELNPKERRIMSVDVALLSSRHRDNDASSIQINCIMQTNSTAYIGNFLYYENHEGMTTDELGLRVMRLFYEFKCTDLALDIRGLGLGVYDFIIKDQYDPSTGQTYKALTISDKQIKSQPNNKATLEDYSSRCKVKNATKAIWGMMGSTTFNNEICILLRNGIQQNKLNLLISEFEAEEVLKTQIKGYAKLSPTEQIKYKAPYIQTTAAINELIGLEHEVSGQNIRVYEKPGARKDRYSSMAYNYYVQCQLERDLKPKSSGSVEDCLANKLPIRVATTHRMFD